jgi:hypothetical protein
MAATMHPREEYKIVEKLGSGVSDFTDISN